jgi:membrane protein involved in colicin uptake
MHDAAIEAGLVARPERVVTVDEFNTAYVAELEQHVERMKLDRTVQELEELEEDGEDDDDIIALLREKRIAEMRAAKQQKTQSKEVRTSMARR